MSHKGVVRRNLRGFDSSGGWLLNAAKIEVSIVFGFIELLSVFIDTLNSHDMSIDVDGLFGENLITSQVVVTNEGLTGLLDFTVLGKLSSSQ